MRSISLLALSVLVALAVLAPGAAAAQEEMPEVIVWVNSLKANPGQGEALTGMLIKHGSETYDPLIAAGAVLNWGVAMNVVHDGNDPSSHVEWVSFLGWKGVDQFMQAFMASQQTLSAEQKTAMEEEWEANVAYGSHADMINQAVSVGGATSGRPGYIHLSYFNAKPGQDAAVMNLWNSWVVPAFDKVAASGDILAYGMHIPALHRGAPWTHLSWYTSANLAARSAVDAALGTPSEEAAASMAEIFAPEHVDQILMVVHFNEAAASE